MKVRKLCATRIVRSMQRRCIRSRKRETNERVLITIESGRRTEDMELYKNAIKGKWNAETLIMQRKNRIKLAMTTM